MTGKSISKMFIGLSDLQNHAVTQIKNGEGVRES